MTHSLSPRLTLICAALLLSQPVGLLAQETTSDSTAQTADTAAPITMEAIEQAWKNSDYVTVRQGLKQLAEAEDASSLAQYRYGRVLVQGRGGPTDLEGAVHYLTLAADRNEVEAMTLLGRIYLSNISNAEDDHSHDHIHIDLKRDPVKAAGLLNRAAALGNAEAQYYLSSLYAAGDGVEKDDTAAFTWMLASAKQEYVEAQYELSRIYSRGIGTEASNDDALLWLEKAASNNHVRAQYFLAVAYESGRGIEANQGLAVDWYTRAAENGLPIAMRNLGTLYLQGEAVSQNVEEGLRWLTQAADRGDASAMSNLGMAYATGMGVEQNDEKAVEWYHKASENGLGRAKVALGSFLEQGRGIEPDLDRAIRLYQDALETRDAAQGAMRLGQLAAAGTLDGKIAPQRAVPWATFAAQNGDTPSETWLLAQGEAGMREAQSALAALYLSDPEDAERSATGAQWLQKAATNGDPQAQAQLGEMHMTGTLVELDYVAAHKWVNIAATLGSSKAAELRETLAALMTPEQVAEAQTAARDWFENEEPQPPATNQTVRDTQ